MANGFTFIPNQPISFDLDTDPCQGFLDKGRCVEFKRTDPIEFQIKREPCGDNLACEELSDPTFGDELLLNGTFTGSAAGWDVDGLGTLLYNSNRMCSDGSGFGTFSQTFNIPAPGNYLFTFELDRTGGDIAVEGSPDVPGTEISSFGSTYSTSDTFTVEVIAQEAGDYTVTFTGVDYNGCVDNCSFAQALSCYNGAGWYAVDGGYQHLPGYNTALAAYDDVFGVGKYYKVVISIQNMTAGEVVINVGSNASESILADITSKAFYINSGTDTGFNIIPDSDFDGFVIIEQIYELTEVSYLYLVDLDLAEVADLSPYITYVGDRINVKFTIEELVTSGGTEGLVPNGCYRIAVKGLCNPANANIVVNPEFLDGTTTFVEGWQRNNGSFQYDTSGGGCEFIFLDLPTWSGSPILRNDIQEKFIPGQYEITIEIDSNTDTSHIGAYAYIDNSFETTPPTKYYTVGTHTFLIDYTTPAVENMFGSPRLYLVASFVEAGVKYDGNIRVTLVEAKRVENNETTDYSGCIQIKSDTQLSCHKWVEGYGGCYGYGFDFRQFKLGMRIPILKDGPEYPVDQNTYLQSDGNRKRTKGERDKIYRVVTDRLSEIEHDALSTMLIAENFLIDGVPFFFSGKNYSPEWPRNRRSSIAKVEIELTKDEVIMAADCGSCDAAPTFIPCVGFCEAAVGLKSNYPAPPGTAGWYMVDGSNLLEYSNGTTYSGTTKTCDGYVDSFTQYGANPFQDGPWRWNSIAVRWEPIIQVTGITFDTPAAGSDTMTAVLLPGCIGRGQTSIDGGLNWTAATAYFSASQWLGGVQFVRPILAFRFRIEMKCAICFYYSTEITLYE